MTMAVRRIACWWFLGALALGSSAQAGEIIQGRVLQAGSAQLSIRAADGRPRVFSVRAGAVITLNGMRTGLAALRPGYSVTVTTSVGQIAVRVDARSTGHNPGCEPGRAAQPKKQCRRAAVLWQRRSSPR
jgi:hypothetical protein